MPFSVIPDVVNQQTIHSMQPSDMAFDAVQKMVEHDISAIVVVDDHNKLIGIVTERDITRRLVALDLNPKDTPLSQLMTSDPETILPGDSAYDALEFMRKRKFRHLPVAEDGQVVGMVSMRDLRQFIASNSRPTRNALLRAMKRLSKNRG